MMANGWTVRFLSLLALRMGWGYRSTSGWIDAFTENPLPALRGAAARQAALEQSKYPAEPICRQPLAIHQFHSFKTAAAVAATHFPTERGRTPAAPHAWPRRMLRPVNKLPHSGGQMDAHYQLERFMQITKAIMAG